MPAECKQVDFPFEVNSLVTFSLSDILADSVTDFDIYAKINNQFILYAGHEYKWSAKELESLKSVSDLLFYTNKDEAAYVDFYLNNLIFYQKLTELKLCKGLSAKLQGMYNLGVEWSRKLFLESFDRQLFYFAQEMAIQLASEEAPTLDDFLAIWGKSTVEDHVHEHSFRVMMLVHAIFNHSKQQGSRRDILLAAFLHDIGKTQVPIELLHRKGKLSLYEQKIIKTHLSSKVKELPPLCSYVIANHHERVDGKGYPNALTGVELLPEVCLVRVADVFDALTTKRPYQNSCGFADALHIMSDPEQGLDLDYVKSLAQIFAVS